MDVMKNTAFNTSEARDCGMHKRGVSSPGPGQYLDPNDPIHSSVSKGLIKYSREKGVAESLGGRKVAPFGSDMGDRFKNGIFENLAEKEQMPGPGEYELTTIHEEGHKTKI
jgi:hypothetical protein